jgi:hypothetical protein
MRYKKPLEGIARFEHSQMLTHCTVVRQKSLYYWQWKKTGALDHTRALVLTKLNREQEHRLRFTIT